MLEEWYCAVKYIAPFIQPNCLQIFLICDTAEITAAEAVVKPLLDGTIPTLGECNIRLSQDVDPALQNIAHCTAKQAMDL